MAHFVFNASDGNRQRAAQLLRAKMWGISRHERHHDALAAGDLALIYLAAPTASFLGRAMVATKIREWTPAEAEAYPGDSSSGVLLSDVEEWEDVISMDEVARRIDPTGSSPLVQANAAAGFQMGVVRITEGEYEAALAVRRETHAN